MSYEHGTPHFNLPQTVGSDTRDWFDTNEAFADIDAAIYSAGQTAETAAQDLDGVKSDVQGLKDADIAMTGRVDGIDSRVGASEQAITRLEGAVADNKQDLMDAICSIEEASATAAYRHLTGEFFWYNDTLYKATADIAVGNQIVPDSNCKTTNITTELLEGGGEVVDQVARDGVAANASAITAINAQLTANGIDFQFAYSGGKYGYEVGGTFHPFRQGLADYTGFGSTSVTITESYDEAYWFATSASDTTPQTIAAPTGSAVVSVEELNQQRVGVTGTANYAAAVFKLKLQPGTLTKYGVGALICCK